MPKFPFTNYHELNLDWILKKVTALFDASEENAATIRTYDSRLTYAELMATNAGNTATAAQQLANAAAENADNALSVAGTADAKADSALTAATTAAGAAAGAMTTAQEARQIAGNAQSAAADAGALANDASNAAAAAQQTADTNAGDIADLQTAVDTISGKVSDIDNKADVIIDSASGSIASFADGANDMPIRSLVTNIEPVQAGSGDPSPTNIRPITGRTECTIGIAGVNWLPNNLSFTDGLRDDAGITLPSDYSHYSEPFIVKPNTQYFARGTIWISGVSVRVYFLDKNKNWILRTDAFTQQSFSFITPINCYYIQVQCSKTVDLSRGMISTDQTASFTPFVGNTVVNISWQSEAGTVYGGTLDIISGLLTVNRVLKVLDGVATVSDFRSFAGAVGYNDTSTQFPDADYSKPIVCNQLVTIGPGVTQRYGACKYSGTSFYFWFQNEAFTSEADAKAKVAAANIQCVYYVLHPATYQLTGQQINTLLGTNNIYSDSGSIANVEYPADTKLYIDVKIAELQALVLEN